MQWGMCAAAGVCKQSEALLLDVVSCAWLCVWDSQALDLASYSITTLVGVNR